MTPEQKLEKIRNPKFSTAQTREKDIAWLIQQLDLAHEKNRDDVSVLIKQIQLRDKERAIATKRVEILRAGLETVVTVSHCKSSTDDDEVECWLNMSEVTDVVNEALKASDDLVPGDEVSDGM